MVDKGIFTHKSRLAIKLLKTVLLAAFFLGLLLSIIQIFFDARQLSQNIDKNAHQMIAMVKAPSLRAAYRLDPIMGQEVLNGLLELQHIHNATISLIDGPELAKIERPLYQSGYRQLSDPVFSPVRTYSIPLYKEEPYHESYGELIINIDTGYDGEDFIHRAILIVISGIIRALCMALLLYWIYSLSLTKPINRLVKHLSSLNPEHPGEKQLNTPKGHEDDELGIWVKTANQLLTNVERNFNLRQKAESQIMRLAHYDYLTRLPNRKALQKHLEQVISHASKNNRLVAVLCLGLDDFKYLNAQFNFNVAEHVLVSLSDRFRKHISERAYIGKLGEDQFAVVMEKIKEPYQATELAQELLTLMSAPFKVNLENISVNGTVGITLFPNDATTVDQLLQQAEFAMIMAKSRSHNRYQFYIATVDTETRQRRKLEMDLHRALEHHEFSLVYQPQVDLTHGRIIGAEALLRWNHPEKGLISPDTFIPMAEHNLDIIPIGNWVLETACHQLHEWHISGYPDFGLAVNLSAVQLRDKEITERLSYLLNKYQIPPYMLELEVTETFVLEDIELSAELLKKIKAIGVKLALDDFGTGYSSLSYLKQFPFDKIKIDKSFIEGIPTNTDNTVIVDAIIQLGNNFNITVLAEGIETQEQEKHLIASNCNKGQGYYYGKPMDPARFIEHLNHSRPTNS